MTPSTLPALPDARAKELREELPALVGQTYRDLVWIVRLLQDRAKLAPASMDAAACGRAQVALARLSSWLLAAGAPPEELAHGV